MSVSVETAERYHGARYGGQVSVEAEVIRAHVVDAILARGFSNIVEDPTAAEYNIEAKFVKLGLDGETTRVGFASTWILYRGSSRDALTSTTATWEESVSRVGWGKARFRDAAARAIAENTRRGLDALESVIRDAARLPRGSARRGHSARHGQSSSRPTTPHTERTVMRHVRSKTSLAGMPFFLAAVLAFGMPGLLRGQEPPTTLTVYAGVGRASLAGDDASSLAQNTRTGLKLGMAFHLPESQNVGWTLGLRYSQRGGVFRESGADVTLALDYLDLYGTLTRHFSVAEQTTARFFLGSDFGFEVGCSLQAAEGGLSLSVGCSEAELNTSFAEFALLVGGGISRWISDAAFLSADLTYHWGATTIDPEGDLDTRDLMIQAGIGLPIG